MSRLDYITIGIVAACILAIIFLVYKMTDLFGGETKTDPIENTTNVVEEEKSDSTYNYDIDEEDSETGNASTDNATTTTGSNGNTSNTNSGNSSTSKIDEEEDRTPVTTEKPTTTTANNSSGKFMVIAGTFSKKASAQQHLKKIKGMGFNNATIEPFDKGKFDVVLVDRFDNMAAAERLVKDLKADGISSYVKAKEAN